MKLISTLRIYLVIFAILLTCSINTAAKDDDCENMTDEQIVAAIYDYISGKYSDHLTHVNVRSKDGVVTLEGWASSRKKKNNIGKFATKLKCVKNVINELAERAGGGCGPGQKRCGTICIPNSETCNIKG